MCAAATKGHEEVTRTLLHHGAKPDYTRQVLRKISLSLLMIVCWFENVALSHHLFISLSPPSPPPFPSPSPSPEWKRPTLHFCRKRICRSGNFFPSSFSPFPSHSPFPSLSFLPLLLLPSLSSSSGKNFFLKINFFFFLKNRHCASSP